MCHLSVVPRRTLLAAGLLAARTVAFWPGLLGAGPQGAGEATYAPGGAAAHAPHARVRSAAFAVPAYFRYDLGQQARRAHTPVKAGAYQPGIPDIEEPLHAAEVPILAVEVVKEWQQQAFNAEGYAFKVWNDTEKQGFYWTMQECLLLMDENIAEGIPRYVFALAPAAASLERLYIDDIKAIAIATIERPPNDWKGTELLHIDGVIAAPTEHQQGRLVAELVRSITRWGANANRFGSVTFSPHTFFTPYYEKLGLSPGDLLWPSMEPPRADGVGSPGDQQFHMVTLKLGAEPGTAIV